MDSTYKTLATTTIGGQVNCRVMHCTWVGAADSDNLDDTDKIQTHCAAAILGSTCKLILQVSEQMLESLILIRSVQL
jgi:hypothetical protein